MFIEILIRRIELNGEYQLVALPLIEIGIGESSVHPYKKLDRFRQRDSSGTSQRYARSVPETYVTAYVTGHGDKPVRVWGVGPGCSSRKGEHVLLTAHENMSR